MPRRFRTLWIAGTHLGSDVACAGSLLAFLEQVTAETIFLVGDIIDLERLRETTRFPASHGRVWLHLCALAHRESHVVYLPGSSDAGSRRFVGDRLSGIYVATEAVHRTAPGERLLVASGSDLDARVRDGSGLDAFSPIAYRWLESADRQFRALQDAVGAPFSPPAAIGVGKRLARARDYVDRFERVALDDSRTRGFDGIVCGHVHKPEHKVLDSIRYANAGDWVDSRTAFAEDERGALQLLQYDGGGIATYPADLSNSLAA